MTEATELYSPSDDSEGPVLRDFVNETLAHERAPEDSPRSALLSTIHGATSHSSQAAVGIPHESRHRRGPSQRYRRERESAYKGLDHREVLRLLIEHEYEASKMRKTLYMVFSQLEAETQRAAEAEVQVKAYSDRFQQLNAEKITAERESHTLEEELTLYKIQYDLAQKEITKARDTVLTLQSELDAAEQVARKARGDARKVKEALEIWKAREEGRRQGFEVGWNRARAEFGIGNAQPVLEYDNEYPDSYPPPERNSFLHADVGESGDGEDTISYRTYPPPEQRALTHFPAVPVVPAPISIITQAQAMPDSMLRQSSVSEHYAQRPVSIQSSSRPPSARPVMATPAVQRYSLPIPPADQVEFDNRPPSPTRQAQTQPQPWIAEPPVPRAPSPRPPDNYIPAASEDGHISLPPPHELAEYPSSPQPSVNALPSHTVYSSHDTDLDEGSKRDYTSSKGKARATDSWYNQRGEVDSRTNIPDAPVPIGLESSTSWYQARLPDERTRHTSMSSRYSVNSSGGLLDAWGYPIEAETKRSGGLGTTLKNIFRGKGKDARMLSIIKENPLSRQGSLNVVPVSTTTVEPLWSSRDPNRTLFPSVSNGSNKMFVDELKYGGPDTTKRKHDWPYEDFSPSKERPPRNVRVPAHLTVPALLSTQQPQKTKAVGHGRAMSMGSADPRFYQNSHPSQTTSEGTSQFRVDGNLGRQNPRITGRSPQTMSGHLVDSTSPPVSISIQPPSQSPSDAPNGLNSATRNGPGTPAEQHLSLTKSPGSLSDRLRSRSTSLNQNQGSHTSPSIQAIHPPGREDRALFQRPQRTGSPAFSDPSNHGRSRTPNSQILHRESSPSDENTARSRRPSRISETLSNPQRRFASASLNQHLSSHPSVVDTTPKSFQTQQPPSMGSHKHSESLDITGTHGRLPDSPVGHTQSHSIEGGAGLKRVMSNLSVRSAGSQYSHFDPDAYRDPAYFSLDTHS
ncbi:hypothetical protein GGU11DRAFT_801408 [Lentinula aff. detonsa]|nr:hypothetical protein GGU11DRAFT_801408 [Lentinula aff. detonsa]